MSFTPKTLDSLLNVAKSVTTAAGTAVTGLLASDVIPVPESWRGAATVLAGSLTVAGVWLTKNKPLIEATIDPLLPADPVLIAPDLPTTLPALSEVSA